MKIENLYHTHMSNDTEITKWITRTYGTTNLEPDEMNYEYDEMHYWHSMQEPKMNGIHENYTEFNENLIHKVINERATIRTISAVSNARGIASNACNVRYKYKYTPFISRLKTGYCASAKSKIIKSEL